MLKYELKKYILKPSVIICLAVLLLVNLVKVLEIYCQGSGRQILFSGKGRIETVSYTHLTLPTIA